MERSEKRKSISCFPVKKTIKEILVYLELYFMMSIHVHDEIFRH